MMDDDGQLEFLVPLHAEDIALEFDDRFCVRQHLEIETLPAARRNAIIQGIYKCDFHEACAHCGSYSDSCSTLKGSPNALVGNEVFDPLFWCCL
jgi:hypothetical protein